MKTKELEKSVVKLYLLNIIANAVPMVCFTILAISFDKWWMILFSILFYQHFKFNFDNKGDK